ncbi:hypothetical protein BDR22DRAFT_968106 [Usnea florida]
MHMHAIKNLSYQKKHDYHYRSALFQTSPLEYSGISLKKLHHKILLQNPLSLSPSTSWQYIIRQHHPILATSSQPTISTYGYTQARSLVYGKHGDPSDVLSLFSHSIGLPHSSLVTLRTLTAPLNPADINQIQGTYPQVPPFSTALGTAKPSAMPENEACFKVVDVGKQTRILKKGD